MKDLLEIIEAESIEILMQLVISPNSDYAAGIEALSRGIQKTTGETILPLKLIHTAKKHGLLKELETLMFKKALESFKPLFDADNSLLLFINVDPDFIEMCIDTQWIDELVEPFGIPKSNIIFDIQTLEFGRLSLAKAFVDQHRAKGFYISIDDLGTEYSNLDRIIYLSPDLVKVNVKSLRKLENQDYVQKMLKVLKPLAESLGIVIVAKGIETESDLTYAMEAGAQYLQGYFISKPLDLTSSSLVDITGRYAQKLKEHARVEVQRLELTRTMTTRAYGIIKSIKAQLDLDYTFGNGSDYHQLFEQFPMVENIWILSDKGIQVGPTQVNHQRYQTKNIHLFQIYNNGSDFSAKELFTQLYDTILDVWVTQPMQSVLTNNLCIGCSTRLDHHEDAAVLGLNINLAHLLNEQKELRLSDAIDRATEEALSIRVYSTED